MPGVPKPRWDFARFGGAVDFFVGRRWIGQVEPRIDGVYRYRRRVPLRRVGVPRAGGHIRRGQTRGRGVRGTARCAAVAPGARNAHPARRDRPVTSLTPTRRGSARADGGTHMTERPFIAFSTATGDVLASAGTAAEARDEAVRFHRLDDDRHVEVLDFGDRADRVMRDPQPLLSDVRRLGRTVFRGGGHEPHLPAVALDAGGSS